MSEQTLDTLIERRQQARLWGARTLAAALIARERLRPDRDEAQGLRVAGQKLEMAIAHEIGRTQASPPEQSDREAYLQWAHAAESLYVRSIIARAIAILEGP